jgi:hypothetical protein
VLQLQINRRQVLLFLLQDLVQLEVAELLALALLVLELVKALVLLVLELVEEKLLRQVSHPVSFLVSQLLFLCRLLFLLSFLLLLRLVFFLFLVEL